MALDEWRENAGRCLGRPTAEAADVEYRHARTGRGQLMRARATNYTGPDDGDFKRRHA